MPIEKDRVHLREIMRQSPHPGGYHQGITEKASQEIGQTHPERHRPLC
nr:MAG TPA: hypothetical protein [Caudoviricetes sp.]